MTEKVKLQLEYIINCSPKVLYDRLSTPSGLSEWFAEDVSVQGNRYTFKWKGAEEVADIVMHKENKLIRFSWIDEPEIYFEFRITQDELTSDVSLIVTDFSEPGETDEIVHMWNNHINDLKHVVGS